MKEIAQLRSHLLVVNKLKKQSLPCTKCGYHSEVSKWNIRYKYWIAFLIWWCVSSSSKIAINVEHKGLLQGIVFVLDENSFSNCSFPFFGLFCRLPAILRDFEYISRKSQLYEKASNVEGKPDIGRMYLIQSLPPLQGNFGCMAWRAPRWFH